jgi:MFS family permease
MIMAKWRGTISAYQWQVLACSWLGWSLDIMDSSLYAMVLFPSVSDLAGSREPATVGWIGGTILSIFMIGWALGGIVFGMMADRLGRARTMAISIVVYSIFTALSGLARTWEELALLRFLTGLGIGGEWAAGAALIAETWPDEHRAQAASVMQSAAGIGHFLAALVYFSVGSFGWRWVFFAGILPGLLAFYIRRKLEEPEIWREVKTRGEAARFGDLFSPALRRDTLVAAAMAVVATMGYFGSILWVPTWIREILPQDALEAQVKSAVTLVTASVTFSGIVGALVFAPVAERWGRKRAFFLYFLFSLLTVPGTFYGVKSFSVAIPAAAFMGLFTGGVFAGFAIYFPELFPTRLRATGQGFAYNFGRLFSALGPFTAGTMVGRFGVGGAAGTVGLIYALGILVLCFARETKGQRLA